MYKEELESPARTPKDRFESSDLYWRRQKVNRDLKHRVRNCTIEDVRKGQVLQNVGHQAGFEEREFRGALKQPSNGRSKNSGKVSIISLWGIIMR